MFLGFPNWRWFSSIVSLAIPWCCLAQPEGFGANNFSFARIGTKWQTLDLTQADFDFMDSCAKAEVTLAVLTLLLTPVIISLLTRHQYTWKQPDENIFFFQS